MYLRIFFLFAVMVRLIGSVEDPVAKGADFLLALESDAEVTQIPIGQDVKFIARVTNRSDETLQGTLRWSFETVAYEAEEPIEKEVKVRAGETVAFEVITRLPVPGFVNVRCKLQSDQLEKAIDRTRRFGAQAMRIRAPLTAEDDFDQFWTDALSELSKVDPGYRLKLQESGGSAGRDLYEVSMKSLGGVRVGGWLEVPKTPGPHPVVLRVPGYGGNMKPVGRWDDLIVFSFNPRAHGNSQKDVPGKPVDYWIRGLDDPKNYYYRGAYLDCVRAVDYPVSRSDVDQKRLAVWGGSQGGGLAFSTSALDSRIDLCVADIPWLCDWVNYFRLTDWPEMNQWVDESEARTWPATLQTLSYFDTLNMADRIHCPTIMGIGLQDAVCPPETSFATYNRIVSEKKFRIYRDRGHGLGSDHWEWVWTQIRQRFELARGSAQAQPE